VTEARTGQIAKKDFAPRAPLGWVDYSFISDKVRIFRGILGILKRKKIPPLTYDWLFETLQHLKFNPATGF
jgi:hypothetical protein